MAQNSSTDFAPGVANRRDFLRRVGLGVGVVASTSALQACDTTDDPLERPGAGIVRGVVVNPDGEPIEGATVSLDGTNFTMETNALGQYEFSDVPAGQYTVSLAAFGAFDPQTASINVIQGGTGYTQNFDTGDTLPVVTFDFSNDFGVLNFAYALEQLEAAFYATVIADPAFADTFTDEEQAILQDLAAHEAIHRDFLAAALGANAIPDLLPNFAGIDLTDHTEVLEAAQVFEDLGVSAYNGAGQYLTDPNLLTIAGKIVSVEARHASVISTLLHPDSFDLSGDSVIDLDGLDRALSPAAVLSAADPFIFNMVSASNVPTTA